MCLSACHVRVEDLLCQNVQPHSRPSSGATRSVTDIFSSWKNLPACKIYACSGGRLLAPINAPHLFTMEVRNKNRTQAFEWYHFELVQLMSLVDLSCGCIIIHDLIVADSHTNMERYWMHKHWGAVVPSSAKDNHCTKHNSKYWHEWDLVCHVMYLFTPSAFAGYSLIDLPTEGWLRLSRHGVE